MRGPRFYRQDPEHAHSDPTALDRKAETLTGQAGRELDRLLRAIRDLKAWEATGHLAPAVDRFKVILTDAESALKGLTNALDKAIADYDGNDSIERFMDEVGIPRGGYASGPKAMSKLPQAPVGPAPGGASVRLAGGGVIDTETTTEA